MPLKEARERAEELRRTLRQGLDPIEQRRASGTVQKGVPTFREIATMAAAEAQARTTNRKVKYQWDLLLGERYCAKIRDKAIDQITTSDIADLLKPVWWAKPETGRKILTKLRRVFDFARVHIRDHHGLSLARNPAEWSDLKDRGFERVRMRTRGQQAALDYREAHAFLCEVRARSCLTAMAVELALLTGLRSREVIEARWIEFDIDKRTWTVPLERLKDRRTRSDALRVPLSTQVIDLLTSIPRTSEFVFPSARGNRPISDMAMLVFIKRLNVGVAGEPRFVDPQSGRAITPHGFRSTFRTWGDDEGYPRDLLEESIGHHVGNSVERAYRRTDRLERRAHVMQAWADHVAGGSLPEAESPEFAPCAKASVE